MTNTASNDSHVTRNGECDILDLIAAGLDNASIAQRLYLNPKTVRNHVSNVFAKLPARDRAAAIVLARQNGLGVDVDPDRPR